MSADHITDSFGRRIYKNYVCRTCLKRYVYSDSLERHRREKHPKKHEREEAKRRKAAREMLARRTKHKQLSSEVVRTALRFWEMMAPDTIEHEPAVTRAMRIYPQFGEACAALNKFEAEDSV